MQYKSLRFRRSIIAAALAATLPWVVSAERQAHQAPELFGVWRGTSICTDRIAAPACQDETVVYEFTSGTKPDTVHWKADKIVSARRETMGELDLAYDGNAGCWSTEFSSPRVHGVWCLAVNGTHISGSAWLLPGRQKVRKIEVDKDRPDELSQLAANARLESALVGWCRGDLEGGAPASFAVAIGTEDGGRYLVFRRDGTTVELAAYRGTPDLACYTPAEARKLSATIFRSATIEGEIAPQWSTTVVCGFVDNTTSVCWQYSPAERKFVRVGGWTT